MKSSILFSAFLILLTFGSFSQDCGTNIEDGDIMLQKAIDAAWKSYYEKGISAIPTSMEFVPVQLRILRQSDGTGNVTAQEFEDALVLVNEYYAYSSVHFYMCSPIEFVDDDTFSGYEKTQMTDLYNAYHTENVINVYSADSVVKDSVTNLCGHAQFPGGLDFVMISGNCLSNGSTFIHEMGHYFGLYHTHETYFGNELVDGSNCVDAGDKLCDTPADPDLSGNVDYYGCIYTGTDVDSNSMPYSPIVQNLMSYASKECRYEFSAQQMDKVAYVLANYRSYLTCSGSDPVAADFYEYHDNNCTDNLTVQFADVSLGFPNGWSWDFGDGNSDNSSQFPEHTYSTPGVYSVSLTSTNGGDSDILNKTEIIKVGSVTLPYAEDFETGSMGMIKPSSTFKNSVSVSSSAGYNSSYGLLLEGYYESSSPYFRTPEVQDAFGEFWNYFYKSKSELCVDATNATDLFLEFDLYQAYAYNDNYTNFRITIDGVEVLSNIQPGGDDGPWDHFNLDISAYDLSNFTITFEASNKYNIDYNTTYGTYTFLDNIVIDGQPLGTISKDIVSSGIVLSPNPAGDYFTIGSRNNEIRTICIYDITGKKVYTKEIDNLYHKVDTRNLTGGIYLVETYTKDGKRNVNKLVVR